MKKIYIYMSVRVSVLICAEMTTRNERYDASYYWISYESSIIKISYFPNILRFQMRTFTYSEITACDTDPGSFIHYSCRSKWKKIPERYSNIRWRPPLKLSKIKFSLRNYWADLKTNRYYQIIWCIYKLTENMPRWCIERHAKYFGNLLHIVSLTRVWRG